MIIFIGEGRMGNQLFQLAFIQTAISSQKPLITCRFDQLLQLLEPGQRILNIRGRFVRAVLIRFGRPFFALLSRARLIRSYKVNQVQISGSVFESTTFSETRGLLPITYVFPCFAQSERFFSAETVKNWKIRASHAKEAKSFLSDLPENSPKVFVHLRRGDYLSETLLGKKDFSLPLTYFRRQIARIDSIVPNAFFVFLTDDPSFVEMEFADLKQKVISRENAFVDFAIMTECQYGIVSNSSFSWWGTYLMKDRKKVIAPKYWLGWKSQIEIPQGIEPSFAELALVENRKDE
jgi:hypothetical protein